MTYVYLLKNRLEIVDRATSVCDLLSIILISETLVACVFFSWMLSNFPGLIGFISGKTVHALPTVFIGGRGKAEWYRRGGNTMTGNYIFATFYSELP